MHFRQKWNPMKNPELMSKLNPYAKDACEKKKKIVKDQSKTKWFREKSQQFLKSVAQEVLEKQDADINYTKEIVKKTKVY